MPSTTGSRARIVQLSAERKALVDRLIGDSAATPPGDAIRRLSPAEPAPLSFAEERTWRLDRFQPGVPWRYLRVALRLEGDLQLEALKESATAVAGRHDILRARYVDGESGVRRIIDANTVLDLPVLDLPVLDLSRAPDPSTAEAILREHAEVLNLGRGPLVRLLLLRIADGDYILSVAAHQMVCDGPSLRIYLSELFVRYEHGVRGTALDLPPLPIQYADFAASQRSPAHLAVQEKDLAYWRSQFAKPVAELRLKEHSAAHGAMSPRSSVVTSSFNQARLAALKRAASGQDATLYMVLLAAFQALLGQYSGMQDFLIGSPAANRTHPDVEGLVGPFANILPLRADLSGDPALRTLISRVRKATLDAFSHAAAAYEQIAEQARLPRLSVVMLLHEPLGASEGGSLKISALPLAHGEIPYDVRLSFLEAESSLVASLEFRDSVFSTEEARRFLSYFDRILTAIVDHPESRLSSLPAHTHAALPKPQASVDSPRAALVRAASGGPPRNRLERELVTLWQTVLGIPDVGVSDNFFALGGNSLSAVRLFLLIEQSLDTRLPLSILLEAPTVETLAEIIRKGGFSRRWTCLVPIQTADALPPFFCVHGAGGNILFLRNLAQHMDRNQPLYGFQAAGLDAETPPLTSVEETARLYISELRTVQPHGPYYLGGYCFGAYAALEMAQQLQQQGEQVAFLASFNETGAWRVVGSMNESIDLHRNALSRLAPRSRMLYLRERILYRATRAGSVALALLGRIAGTGPSRSAAAAQIRVERALHAAGMRYKPRPYEGCFALFRSETVAEPRGQTFWEQIVRGEIESYVFPGGEDRLFDDPAAPLLAKQLTHCLERARLNSRSNPTLQQLNNAHTEAIG